MKKNFIPMGESEEENVCEVERVVGCRMYKGRKQYFIKWVGFPTSENTWEYLEDMQCDRLVEEFEARRRKRNEKGNTIDKNIGIGKRNTIEDNNINENNQISILFNDKNLENIKSKYNLPDNRTIPNIYDCLVKKVEEIKGKFVVVRFVDDSLGEIDLEIAKMGLPLHIIDYYESKSK